MSSCVREDERRNPRAPSPCLLLRHVESAVRADFGKFLYLANIQGLSRAGLLGWAA